MAEEFLKQYQILLKKAIVDFNAAKIILTSFEEGKIELDLEIIMFHLQQATEKLIKCVLDFNKIKFPHSHDLRELSNILNDHNIKIKNIEPLIPLSIYSVNGRYGIIQDDLNDVEKYIELVEKLLSFVKISIND